MGLVFTITVGATVQVALLTAPVLVIISYFMGYPMNLVFPNPIELIAIAAVAFGVGPRLPTTGRPPGSRGCCSWRLYVILGMAFFWFVRRDGGVLAGPQHRIARSDGQRLGSGALRASPWVGGSRREALASGLRSSPTSSFDRWDVFHLHFLPLALQANTPLSTFPSRRRTRVRLGARASLGSSADGAASGTSPPRKNAGKPSRNASACTVTPGCGSRRTRSGWPGCGRGSSWCAWPAAAPRVRRLALRRSARPPAPIGTGQGRHRARGVRCRRGRRRRRGSGHRQLRLDHWSAG